MKQDLSASISFWFDAAIGDSVVGAAIVAITKEELDNMQVNSMLTRAVTAALQSPKFAKAMKARVADAVTQALHDMLEEGELAEKMKEDVKALVLARWEADVAAAARSVLTRKLSEIESRLEKV